MFIYVRLYVVHCTLYGVQYTRYIVHCSNLGIMSVKVVCQTITYRFVQCASFFCAQAFYNTMQSGHHG